MAFALYAKRSEVDGTVMRTSGIVTVYASRTLRESCAHMRVIPAGNGGPTIDSADISSTDSGGIGGAVLFQALDQQGIVPLSERIFWFPVIVLLGLFGTGGILQALASGSGHGGGVRGRGVHSFGSPAFRAAPFVRVSPPPIRANLVAPGVVPRQLAIGDDLLLRRRAQFENGWPIGIWPFWSDSDTIPMLVPSSGSGVPTGPPVIVVSGSPNGAPERTASATLPDYSYVAGCHAIPNGYHCDAPHGGAAH